MLRRNVLIFQTGGLGDFVLTWPFATALGRIYAQSRIVYVTHQQKGELARKVLGLEAADIELGWHGLYAQDGTLPATAMALLQSAHAVYSFLPVNAIWHQNVERINPAAKRVEIDGRIMADYPGHVTAKIIESMQGHAPERAATEQILRSISARGIGFKPAGGDAIVIHPGSGSAAKCWPLRLFIELANRLRGSGRKVRFVIGEVEHARWSESDLRDLQSAGEVRPCGTLLELLNELATAATFIGNDSGPAHLAGIIGVPTVALFGPTNPKQWAPLGPRVTTLGAFESLTVEDGLAAVNSF